MEDKELPAEVGRWLDEMFALLFDPQSKGGEHAMTCPNCDGVMELDEDSGVWVCPDCQYSEQRD